MMQIHSDSILIFLHRIDSFAHLRSISFAKLQLLIFVWNFDYSFWRFWKKLSEKLSKVDISAFFQFFTKLSISVEDSLKLSAIWTNYRLHYQYQKWQENYREFIVIEKNDLSYTPTCKWFEFGAHYQNVTEISWSKT